MGSSRVRSANGEVTSAGGTVLDISEHKEVEEALRESEAKYRFLFKNSKDVIYVCSRDGYLIDFNPALIETFGYTSEELLAMKVEALFANPSDRGFLEQIEKQGFVKDGLVNLKKKDGANFSVLATAGVRRDRKGNIVGYQGIFRGITPQERAGEEVRRNCGKLKKIIEDTIRAIALVAGIRDPYTADHHTRVAKLACAVAEEMGVPGEQIDGVKMAAAIHDIGKICVPAEILNKPGRINEIEFSLIKEHPQVGYEILKMIEFPWPIAQIVLQHHERVNGSGYPSCLLGPEILLEAKILGVADVVGAMASHRPYRPALRIEDALGEIEQSRGVLYDSDVVDACLKVFREKGFELD